MYTAIWVWVKTLAPSEPQVIAGIHGCSSHQKYGINMYFHRYWSIAIYEELLLSKHRVCPLAKTDARLKPPAKHQIIPKPIGSDPSFRRWAKRRSLGVLLLLLLYEYRYITLTMMIGIFMIFHDQYNTVWQCVKTNSTPVVHPKS